MTKKEIYVQKSSSETELFSKEKLALSLERSGANKDEIKTILDKINIDIYDGISTNEIYKKAFSFLKKVNHLSASKYSLKRAIFDLGPTGFPFERLVAALLREKGFKTKVGVILNGACVTHEIDVLAEKDETIYAVECKFHSDPRAVSNVKIPLYINSRFLDIQQHWNIISKNSTHLKQGWLVTNTRFTKDAIQYGECIGLSLMSWDYPSGSSIKNNIDSFQLYPVTTLLNLTKEEKSILISKNIILVKELKENINILKIMKIDSKRISIIINETNCLYYN